MSRTPSVLVRDTIREIARDRTKYALCHQDICDRVERKLRQAGRDTFQVMPSDEQPPDEVFIVEREGMRSWLRLR
jgi:hypothetical protein